VSSQWCDLPHRSILSATRDGKILEQRGDSSPIEWTVWSSFNARNFSFVFNSTKGNPTLEQSSIRSSILAVPLRREVPHQYLVFGPFLKTLWFSSWFCLQSAKPNFHSVLFAFELLQGRRTRLGQPLSLFNSLYFDGTTDYRRNCRRVTDSFRFGGCGYRSLPS